MGRGALSPDLVISPFQRQTAQGVVGKGTHEMKHTIRGMLLGAMIASAPLTAQGQGVLYFDLSEAESLWMTRYAEEDRAQLDEMQRQMRSLEAELQSAIFDAQQRELITVAGSEADLAQGRRIEEAQEALQRFQNDYEINRVGVMDQRRREMEAALRPALTTYLQGSNATAVYGHRSGAEEEGVIVINPDFDIAAEVLALADDPGANVAPPPSRAPRVVFLTVDRAMYLSGFSGRASAEIEEVSAPIRNELERLREEYTELARRMQQPVLSSEALQEMNQKRSDVIESMRELEARGARQMSEAEASATLDFRSALSDYLSDSSLGLEVDIVRLVSDRSDGLRPVYIADKADITAQIAAGLKKANDW